MFLNQFTQKQAAIIALQYVVTVIGTKRTHLFEVKLLIYILEQGP